MKELKRELDRARWEADAASRWANYVLQVGGSYGPNLETAIAEADRLRNNLEFLGNLIRQTERGLRADREVEEG